VDPDFLPEAVDLDRPNVARIYDWALGGTANWAIDRQYGRQAVQAFPLVKTLARSNRDFLGRAVRYCVSQGITQFLDLGSGLPTAENTHQVVQRINPETKVVYVDNDPVVLAHGRALLEENEYTHFVAEDIFEPQRILENEVIREHIDFTKPLVLLQMGTLHHFNGPKERPAEIMKEYVDALPSGSFVGISHFFDPENEDSATARRMEDFFLHSPMGSGTFRTQKEIEELFPGLEMVEPGVTLCADWWPDGPRLKELNVAQRTIAGGVGRKP